MIRPESGREKQQPFPLCPTPTRPCTTTGSHTTVIPSPFILLRNAFQVWQDFAYSSWLSQRMMYEQLPVTFGMFCVFLGGRLHVPHFTWWLMCGTLCAHITRTWICPVILRHPLEIEERYRMFTHTCADGGTELQIGGTELQIICRGELDRLLALWAGRFANAFSVYLVGSVSYA